MAKQQLKTYRSKRDFDSTPEPEGRIQRGNGRHFVIQKHAARRLHFDFRLELDGVLKSWAVTRGPSLDPADKRLAVRTEDHPVEYGTFEGIIPRGYGAGTVMLWDRGTWSPRGDPRAGLENGALKFTLIGERLRGGYALIRMKSKQREKRENWLLIKERDNFADRDRDPTAIWTRSVDSSRSMDRIGRGGDNRTPQSKRKGGEAPMPDFIPPQLAVLSDEPPDGDDWLHELKYDGYRIQAHVKGETVRLFTRNRKDWTDRFMPIAQVLGNMDVESAIVDGELVAVNEAGRSSFSQLQNAVDDTTLHFYAFDLLYLNGEKLTSLPLTERKAKLKRLTAASSDRIRYSDHVEGSGERVIGKACAMGLEGIVSKKRNASYRSGRGRGWVKTKCIGNDEFIVVGYRQSDKAGRPFSSLLLAEYVGDALVYRGRVGTGFDTKALKNLSAELARLKRATSPLGETPQSARSRAVWVEPKLIAQIAYTEQTSDGRLRHPSFLGLREDKAALEVRKMKTAKSERTTSIGGVRLTSPDKIMFPGQGATKRDIAEYYERNADRVLRFLAGRPLSLVRCPSGRDKQCFFQRHHTDSVPSELEAVRIEEKNGRRAPCLIVRSAEGLIATTQIGALELHLWGARDDRIERPERVVFDLDPDTRVPFKRVREAARELRGVLSAIDLDSFPLLTGGKGIHVVIPLIRRRGWDDCKQFARGLARRLAAAAPQRYVAVASKKQREGRIFIDWLRNERGATAVAPYSLRARPGAPIATPVSWTELGRVGTSARYTLDNIDRRLERLESDPWEGYFELRQSITNDHLEAAAD